MRIESHSIIILYCTLYSMQIMSNSQMKIATEHAVKLDRLSTFNRTLRLWNPFALRAETALAASVSTRQYSVHLMLPFLEFSCHSLKKGFLKASSRPSTASEQSVTVKKQYTKPGSDGVNEGSANSGPCLKLLSNRCCLVNETDEGEVIHTAKCLT
jgi:hypothetical protein